MEILVPIDDSDSAREAVEYSIREYPDASITVLHVVTPNASYGMNGMYTHSSVLKSQEDATDDLFATATEMADDLGGSVTTMTAIGSPVREIVGFADESDTDHIVVGSHGRSGLLHLLWGSVAEGVVRRASVPVTVVK